MKISINQLVNIDRGFRVQGSGVGFDTGRLHQNNRVKMSAFGRKRTLKFPEFSPSERPVLGKADIMLLIPKQPFEYRRLFMVGTKRTNELWPADNNKKAAQMSGPDS